MTNEQQLESQVARGNAGPALPVPPALAREALPMPSGGVESVTDSQQPNPPASGRLSSDARSLGEFVEFTHQYVREYIQLADQKAAFLFAGGTALLAFLHKSGVSTRWLTPVMQWNVLDIVAFVAMTALAVGILLAVWVVVPRTSGSRRGLLFWEAIADYDSGREYSDDLRQLSTATLSQVTAEHCFDLARVCRKKYRVLRAAIWAGSLGLAAAVLLFLFA